VQAGSSRENHRAILTIIPLAVSALLRIYPSQVNGAPWGTDGWSLLRISKETLALGHIPTVIPGNPILGLYQVYWPVASIFGSMAALILNLQPLVALPIVIPLVSSLTTLFLFVIIDKVTKSAKVACIGSLLFTTASFDSIFTASVTKETYAEPLFMAGIALAYLLLFAEPKLQLGLRGTAIFALILVALALSHHATSVIFAVTVLALAVGRSLVGTGGNILATVPRSSLVNIVALPTMSFAIVGAYLYGYGIGNLPFPVTLNDLPYLSSFLILSFVVAIYFSLERESKRIRFLLPALLYALALLLFVLSEFTHLFPLAPIISQSVAFDALPYLIVGIILVAGYSIAQSKLVRPNFSFLAIWAAVPIGLFGFVVFAAPAEGVYLYRLFTFVYAPFSAIAAVAFYPLFVSANNSRQINLLRIGALTLVLAIVLLSSFQSYSAVVKNQNLLGGQWAYKPTDLAAASWANDSIVSGMSLAGDEKIAYLYSEYYGINVSYLVGYSDLTNNLGQPLALPLVTYGTMGLNGYDLFLYGEPLPPSWQITLAGSSSLIYNNGNEEIWA
jgi:hypothetical protein